MSLEKNYLSLDLVYERIELFSDDFLFYSCRVLNITFGKNKR